ncbi:MAG: MBL fold metallo-hydrolase [Candidatus Cloacimonetes bacterium]|nr:MBL fold metallo-hydrolase [Candidatus Cloacimonadota bacterium]MDD3234855.1 MBL fold metallo-hydrolase [Candidatus Cloacimonadota bacterium]
MEAIILGAGSGLPQADRNLSSVLIRNEGCTVLADCGDGCTKRLIESKISPEELDAVFITHYHPDHVSGLFILLQWLYLAGRTKPLYLFLPERPSVIMDILHVMYTFTEKFSFKLQILEMEQAELYFDWIYAANTDHLYGYTNIIKDHSLANQMKSYSLKFTGAKGDLVYSSDLGTTDCIAEFINGVDTIIVDAGHPEAEQILKLKYRDIRRIILTHGISVSLEARKDELDKDLYEFAEEDLVYVV